MKRDHIGHYETTWTLDEAVRAFVPAPLPPDPDLDIASFQSEMAKAHLALGRLDGLALQLPAAPLFLYSYVRKEAVLSSQIEGTQSSLSDLMLFEMDEAPGAPFDDVVEVSNYVRAMDHGLRRLRDGFPLSNRLIREIHEQLLSRGRGSDKLPGEFRRSQKLDRRYTSRNRELCSTAPHSPARLHGKPGTVSTHPGFDHSSSFESRTKPRPI